MAEVHDPLQLWVAAREQGFPAMVRYATQRPLAVKMVLCQPLALTGVADREAATAVTDALAAGRLQRWEAAALLSVAPHPVALSTALTLLSRDRYDADVYAARAVGRMRDTACVPTLRSLLAADAPNDAVRGAALALAQLCGAASVPTLRDAFRRRTIVARTAGRALALAAVDDDTLTAWLSGDAQDAALALEALHNLVAPPLVYPPTRPPPHSRVAPAVRAALTHAPHELLASERECVEAWLGSV